MTRTERAMWRREAQENAGRAIDSLFEVVVQVLNGRHVAEPHNLFNAGSWTRFADMSADYALECAAKVVR